MTTSHIERRGCGRRKRGARSRRWCEFLQDLGSRETEFERLHAQELELRKTIKGFRAGDRMSRDEVHDRARERMVHDEARERRS